MKYYTTAKISDRISKTPEGFLLCVAVPVARSGELLYQPGELKGEDGNEVVKAGKDGVVRISRTAADIFDESTIASLEGKSVTINHPTDFVSPDNWKEVTVGHMQNVRPGKGADADKLLADFLIKDAAGIAMIEAGLREVSLGYSADYEQLEDGYGRQTNIVGNHVALVRRGRNGPEVAVRDSAPDNPQEVLSMKDKLLKLLGRAVDEAMPEAEAEVVDAVDPMEARIAKVEELLAKIVAAKEEPVAEEVLDEEPELVEEPVVEEVVDEKAAAMDERLAAIEAALAKLVGDEEAPAVACDAETVSRAEILAPGLKSKHLVKDSLAAFGKTEVGAQIMSTFDGMPDEAKFRACAEVMKAKRAAQLAPTHDSFSSFAQGPMTPEKLNERNAARHSNKGA